MSSAATEETTPPTTKPSPEETPTVADMKKAMGQKTGEGKSIWAMTLETFGMADAKSKKLDNYVDTEADALKKLQELVEGEEFPYSPLEEFKATKDDLLKSFLKWAREVPPSTDAKVEEEEDSEQSTELRKFNVTKAHRRLLSYIAWMAQANEKHQMFANPLTAASVQPAYETMAMRMSHDSKNRLVWWVDLGAMDLAAISKQSKVDTIRFMVWATHFVLLDANAQEHGMLFIEHVAQIGFWKILTALPMEVGAQMDRLTIGVLPIKTKGIYLLNTPRWTKLLLGMMKPFMSKKMRSRIVIVKEQDEPAKMIQETVGGAQFIPHQCTELEGTLEKDLLAGYFNA